MNKHTINEASPDVGFVADHLRKTQVGETVTYAEITEILSRSILANRHILEAARRKLVKEGYVFGAVRGVGIKRFSDSQAISVTASDTVAKIRKTARRGLNVLAHGISSFEALSNADKIKHNAAAAMLGVVAHVSTERKRLALEKSISEAQPSGSLPIGRTLELFK